VIKLGQHAQALPQCQFYGNFPLRINPVQRDRVDQQGTPVRPRACRSVADRQVNHRQCFGAQSMVLARNCVCGVVTVRTALGFAPLLTGIKVTPGASLDGTATGRCIRAGTVFRATVANQPFTLRKQKETRSVIAFRSGRFHHPRQNHMARDIAAVAHVIQTP